MKTNHVPATVMLVAGAVYCLFGILNRIALREFTIQLIIVLLVFYVLGGIIKMFLDRFMGEVRKKQESEEVLAEVKEAEGTKEEASEASKETSEDEGI